MHVLTTFYSHRDGRLGIITVTSSGFTYEIWQFVCILRTCIVGSLHRCGLYWCDNLVFEMNIASSPELIVALHSAVTLQLARISRPSSWSSNAASSVFFFLFPFFSFSFSSFFLVANVKHCIVGQNHVLSSPCWKMLFVDLKAAWAWSWCLLVTWDYLSNTTVNYSRDWNLCSLWKPVRRLSYQYAYLDSLFVYPCVILCVFGNRAGLPNLHELIRTYRTYFFRLIL
jgi:hypothetical protein